MQDADLGQRGTARASVQEALEAFGRGEASRWEVLGLVCRHAAGALRTARAGVWALGPAPGRLACLRLHDLRDGRDASGAVLQEADTAPLLQALWRDMAIVVPDAGMHPATRGIYDRVLWPHGIHALIGAAIAVEGRPVGLLLCEQELAPRRWEEHEVEALRALAQPLGPLLREAG